MYIRRGFEEITTYRRVENLLVLLSDVGGLGKLIHVVFLVLLSKYAESKFLDSALKHLFKVQTNNMDN